jgi:thioredoxin
VNGVDELAGTAAVREVLGHEPRGVLVDFWSPWCAPCRALRPHIARLAEERSADWRIVAVNTEEHPAAAEDFGVRGLPTLIFFRDGKELHRLSGGALVSTIAEQLDSLA